MAILTRGLDYTEPTLYHCQWEEPSSSSPTVRHYQRRTTLNIIMISIYLRNFQTTPFLWDYDIGNSGNSYQDAQHTIISLQSLESYTSIMRNTTITISALECWDTHQYLALSTTIADFCWQVEYLSVNILILPTITNRSRTGTVSAASSCIRTRGWVWEPDEETREVR